MGKKQLAGKRCRLTALPSAEDAAKLAGVSIDPENPFGNAEAVQQACGWQVIKGYAMFEVDGTSGGAFVGHKRWWNQKESGVWVDATPRVDGVKELVLLESALSTKSMVKMTSAVRKGAAERLAMGGLAKASAQPSAAKLPTAPPAAPAAPSKPKPKPPPTPAKLEFKGSEPLEEMVQLLTRGTTQAQTRAAAALASQAATGPAESKRIVAAGGLQPLLLLLRREGDVQDHAARAIMSESPFAPASHAALRLAASLLDSPTPQWR